MNQKGLTLSIKKLILIFFLSTSNAWSMDLFYKPHYNGEILWNNNKIDVEPADTIETVIIKIKNDLLSRFSLDIPATRINVIFAGQILENERVVSDYNIQHESTVNVFFNPIMEITSSAVSDGDVSTHNSIDLIFTSNGHASSISDFTESDIIVSGGVISKFSGTDDSYTATLEPSGVGEVTVNIAAGTFSSLGINNTISTEFNWTYQSTNLFSKSNLGTFAKQGEILGLITNNLTDSIRNRIQNIHYNSNNFSQGVRIAYNGSNELLRNLFSSSKLGKYINFERKLGTEWNIWTDGSISYGKIDDSVKHLGSKLSSDSLTIGGDKRWSDGYVYGFSLNKSWATNDTNGNNNDISVDGLTIASYHSLTAKNDQFIDFILSYGLFNIDYTRASSSNNLYYNASRDAETLGFSINYSTEIPYDRFVLMPIGEIRNGLIKIEKTTESNGIESIFADDQHIKFSSALIGLKANIDPIEWKNNSIKPFASLSYRENLNDTSKLSANYILDQSTNYVTNIEGQYSGTWILGVGSIFDIDNNLFGSINYQYTDLINYGHINEVKLNIKLSY